MSYEDKVKDLISQDREESDTQNQFGVAQIPFHTHNGADSQRVFFSDLIGRNEFLHVVLPGTSPATASNYGVFFIAPYSCSFVGATEVHGTKGTDVSAVSLQIEKLTGTTASGSGTNLLATGFDLKGNINTVQTAVLAFAVSNTFNLVKGDRLGFVLSGTPTSVAQLVMVCQLTY